VSDAARRCEYKMWGVAVALELAQSLLRRSRKRRYVEPRSSPDPKRAMADRPALPRTGLISTYGHCDRRARRRLRPRDEDQDWTGHRREAVEGRRQRFAKRIPTSLGRRGSLGEGWSHGPRCKGPMLMVHSGPRTSA